MSSIKYVRLYSDPDGKSRVQKDLEIELTTLDCSSSTRPEPGCFCLHL